MNVRDHLEKSLGRVGDNIKMDLKFVFCGLELSSDWFPNHGNEDEESLDYLSNY